MGKFEDRLLGDLMSEHGSTLAEAQRPAPRRATSRPLWIGGAALGVATAAAVGTTLLGGGSPAYAVTQNPDGTVTVSIKDINAVDAANAELSRLGLPVRAVPLRKDCPDKSVPDERFQGKWITTIRGGEDGYITIPTEGIPAGSSIVLAAKAASDGRVSRLSVTTALKAPIPSCLLDEPAPAEGPVSPPSSR